MHDIEETAKEIVDAALLIHRTVGPGMFESAYETMLAYELEDRGHHVERQKYISLKYRTLNIERAYCVDLFVNECVPVEVKAVTALAPAHVTQVVTYLKMMDLQVGLLINFGQPTLKAGLRRVMNDYPDPRGTQPVCRRPG